MSFLKIIDRKKRDFIVNEFLMTRQNMKQNFLSERVDDLSPQYELSKLFKLVTDMQNGLKEHLVSELNPIREGMKNLPKAITFPQFSSITAYDDDDDGEVEEDVFIGDIAEQYLRKFPTVSSADKMCQLRDKDGKLHWEQGSKNKGKQYNFCNKEYTGTPGLWELIVARSSDDKIFTNGIMIIMQK